MHRSRRRAIASRAARTPWHPRVCERHAVALRVDYATPQGQSGLGLIRNLSLQGMFLDSACRHVRLGMAPGDLLTVAFVLPSGRPCKLRAVVVHCQRYGCGVQFREGHTQSLVNLAHYWASLEKKA